MADLFAWRSALLSLHGPPSTTRLVLLTLSTHADQNGDDIFPATRALAVETGLSRTCVMQHLDAAESGGWIRRHVLGTDRGRGWKRHRYDLRVPPEVVNEDDHEGGQRGSPRSEEGGQPHVDKVVNEVDHTSSVTSSRRTDTSKPEIPVSDLWEAFLDELGGNGRQPKLTPKRRTKLKALYIEQLEENPNPVERFRKLLRTVKDSDHHMSQRTYQMPESLFRNPERRDRWMSQSENGARPKRRNPLDAKQNMLPNAV